MNKNRSEQHGKKYAFVHWLINIPRQQRLFVMVGFSAVCGWIVFAIPLEYGGFAVSFFSMLPSALGGLLYGVWGGVITGVVFSLVNLLHLARLGDYHVLTEGGLGGMASLLVFGALVGYLSQLFRRLQAEKARQEWAEERYRQAVELSPNPIFSIHRDGSIAGWNAACETFFGHGPEIIGQAVQRMFCDEAEFDRLMPWITQVFQDRKAFADIEINFCTREGRKLTMRSRMFPVTNREGQVVECIFGNTNITDIRHLQTIEHEHLMNMTLLNEIARLAVSAADMQGMLDGFAECAARILSAEGVLLATRSSVGAQPYRVAYFGSFNNLNRDWLPEERDAFLAAQFAAEEGGISCGISAGASGEWVASELGIPDALTNIYPNDRFDRMALRAGGEDGRELLGFGLVHFHPGMMALHRAAEYREIADQVARQIALGILKLEALLKEQERTRQLMKANAMITALSHVAAQVEISSEPEEIMNTLGDELMKMKVYSMLALFNSDQTQCTIRYISMPEELLADLREMYGSDAAIPSANACFSTEHAPTFHKVLTTRRPIFGTYRKLISNKWLEEMPVQTAQMIRAILSRAVGQNYIVLPLMGEDTVLGILYLMGQDLQAEDMPTATLFASQVSAAIRKARQYHEVQQMASTDELTRVFNRRQVMVLAERFFSNARCQGNSFCMLLIDVDHFKLVNDRYGHLIGDQVLREVAARWRKDLREHDVIGRYGGEEFLVLLQTGDLGLALQIAERLRVKVAGNPVPAQVGEAAADVSVTTSIGLTAVKADDERLDAVIERADRALYLAKQAGRNCTRIS